MALEAVQVKIFRRSIRCKDHHHARLDKRLEQSLQNHGVGDVEHLEFVDEEERLAQRELIADDGDCLADPAAHLLVDFVLHFVDLEHELVVVLLLLSLLQVHAMIEQLCQKAFATTWITPHVNAL